MQYFRYQADRLPILVIVSLFVADLAVYFLVESPLLVTAWMLIGIGPKLCICAWNHHHQHVPTFRQQSLNRLLEIVYAFHTGITTNAWVLHHNLGHHLNYLDQTKDESGWKTKSGRVMGPLEYALKIALTGYLRAYRVGKSHPRFQKGFLQAGILMLILLAGLLWWNWINALIIFLIPMLIGYIGTCWHTYYHHAGLDTDNPLHASYNITHKWYNRLTGNLGLHTAHHMKQALHWSKLPEYHRKIASQIPPELFHAPCIPFRWMPAGKKLNFSEEKLCQSLTSCS